MRRPVRQGRERDLDRLGPFEQPQGPQRRLALDAVRPCACRGRGQQCCAGTASAACSGMCVSCGRCTTTRRRRSARRGGRSARKARHCRARWHRNRAAAAPRFRCGADRRTRSKPKPGSSGSFNASSCSPNRRSTTSRRVIGWPASTAIVRTAPSVRKKLASSSRAPLPCRSIAAISTAASARERQRDGGVGCDRFGKTFFHHIIRRGFRGEIGASPCPSACCSIEVKPRRTAQ